MHFPFISRVKLRTSEAKHKERENLNSDWCSHKYWTDTKFKAYHDEGELVNIVSFLLGLLKDYATEVKVNWK